MNFLIAIALEDCTYQYHTIQAKDEEEAEVIAENFLEAIKRRELWDHRKHGNEYKGIYTELTYVNVVSAIKGK